MTLRRRVLIVSLFSLFALTLPALARDSAHWVCTGFITIQDAGGTSTAEKLVWVYQDQRAAGGHDRDISVETFRNNVVYKGTITTHSDIPHLKIVAVGDDNDILFDGTVMVVGGSDFHAIQVEGKYTPHGMKAETIKATLEGPEIP